MSERPFAGLLPWLLQPQALVAFAPVCWCGLWCVLTWQIVMWGENLTTAAASSPAQSIFVGIPLAIYLVFARVPFERAWSSWVWALFGCVGYLVLAVSAWGIWGPWSPLWMLSVVAAIHLASSHPLPLSHPNVSSTRPDSTPTVSTSNSRDGLQPTALEPDTIHSESDWSEGEPNQETADSRMPNASAADRMPVDQADTRNVDTEENDEEELDIEEAEAEWSAEDNHWIQQMTRRPGPLENPEVERIEWLRRWNWPGEQSLVELHVLFQPAFAETPSIQVGVLEGPGEVKVADAFPHGARLELKRSTTQAKLPLPEELVSVVWLTAEGPVDPA